MSTFKLPDLGEGLPEAEIVNWHVKEGDSIKVDEPMLSVETAKAVVEVPAPQTGVITKLHAGEGDIVKTGHPLVDFAGGEASAPPPQAEPAKEDPKDDSGTVVGNMPSSNNLLVEKAIVGGRRRRKKGRVKAAPAVRALAKKMQVDLSEVTASGKNGQVTAADVRTYAQTSTVIGPTVPAAPPRSDIDFGVAEKLRGPRRAMSQSMSASRDQVAACTLFDDADIHDWAPGQDITTRVLRSVAAGARAEPGLNAWYNDEEGSRTLHQNIDLAMAVDTPDGLIVPVIRDIGRMDGSQLRAAVDRIKVATRNRTVSPAEMQNPTITLSNFGMMAGRYATPVIVPPMVCIIGTGGIRHDVVAVMGGIEVHRRIPLSLTFDHRCITGGEACRFLAAMIADLGKPD